MTSSLAQEAVIPAGGDGTGSGGSIAYSIAQILYTGSYDVSGEVLQGVQQPYEIYLGSNRNHFEDIGISLSTYPNPVRGILILKVEAQLMKEVSFKLYNSEGQVSLTGKLLNTETRIDMSQLTPGVYFLQVNILKETAKTFKIIKP